MSWVTIIWSMVASACLMLAAVPLLVWFQRREEWGNLFFSLTAAATAGMAFCELWMMLAQTPEQYATALRWIHLPTWLAILSLTGFVRIRLRAGRPWLAWTLCSLRTVALVLNFTIGENLNYVEVTGLRFVPFLGDAFAVAEGVPNPWMLFGQLSLWLFVAFVTDALFTVWRRGDPRLALVTAMGIFVFVLLGTVQAALVLWRVVDLPVTPSLFFLGLGLVTVWEMSREALRTARLSADLRESESRYRGIFDGAMEGIYRTTPEGRILVANPALARMLGYDSAQDLISAVQDTAHQVWADPGERSRYLQRLEEQTTMLGYECRFRRRDGTPIWVSLNGRLVRDGNGRTLCIEGFIEDITERRHAEKAAAETAARATSVLDAMAEGMILQNAAGHVVTCNPRAAQMIGLPAEALEGTDPAGLPWRIVREDGSPLPAGEHPATVALRTGRPCAEAVLGLHRTDGQVVWLSMNSRPLVRTGERAPYAVVTTFSDIGALRQMELDAARLRQDLAHISRLGTMGELVASLAHELNQPLAAILSNAQAAQRLLSSDPPDMPEIRAILADVIADDQRAGEVVRRVRALVKKAPIQRERIDMNEVIREVVGFLRTDAILRGVTVVARPAAAPLPVLGDRVQLQQVLLNLITNAFDAMQTVPGQRRELKLWSGRSDTGSVAVSVRDAGEGVSPEAMDHLFEPFFSTKTDGLGMGLPICRVIVEAHGGRIWAESGPGQGTTMRFELPAALEG